jgi:hypothetical protein
VPEHLDAYITVAATIADELTTKSASLGEGLEALRGDARRYSIPHNLPDIDSTLKDIAASVRVNAELLAAVRDVVKKADGTPLIVDSVTVDNQSIDKAKATRPIPPQLLSDLEDASPEKRWELWNQLDPALQRKLFEERPDLFPIPSPPPPPEKGKDGDGAGWDETFATRPPTLKERRTKAEMRAQATAADALGLTDASRHLNHYLDAGGSPMTLDVDKMLREVPAFERTVDAELQAAIQQEADRAIAAGRYEQAIPFSTPWHEYTFDARHSRNWHLAVASCHFSVTGYLVVRQSDPPTVEVVYKTHVVDRYNFDYGKVANPTRDGTDHDTDDGSVPDDDLANLHVTGLAREYEMSGSSALRTYP